jgi:uncharacterized protein
MKITRILAALLLTALCLAVTASAERTLPLVVDDADILTVGEENLLLAKLEALSQDLSCEIAVVTVSSLDGKHVQDYADDFYDDNGYGYGSGDDGVLLLLSMSEREWAITTYGTAMYALSDAALYYIEDQMLPALSRGDYDEGFLTFAEGCARYVRHYLTPNESDKDDPWISYVEDPDFGDDYGYGESFDVKGTLLVAVGIGIAVAFIVVSAMKSQLTSVRSRHEANAYIRTDGLRLTASRDVFLYRNVTRIRRDTDNHGGGARSGGSRSGGFSSHRSSSGRSHGGRSGRF